MIFLKGLKIAADTFLYPAEADRNELELNLDRRFQLRSDPMTDEVDRAGSWAKERTVHSGRFTNSPWGRPCMAILKGIWG